MNNRYEKLNSYASKLCEHIEYFLHCSLVKHKTQSLRDVLHQSTWGPPHIKIEGGDKCIGSLISSYHLMSWGHCEATLCLCRSSEVCKSDDEIVRLVGDTQGVNFWTTTPITIWHTLARKATGNNFAHDCAIFMQSSSIVQGLCLTARVQVAPKEEVK